MSRFTKFVSLAPLGFLLIHLALAQSDCPAMVERALQTVADACAAAQRNQVCYGNVVLEADPRPGVSDFAFDQSGDLANLADIKSLKLSPLSVTDETWGVALMKVQANLPDTLPGQNVTMILFGDVEIADAAQPLTEIEAQATGNVNVRLRPTTAASNVMSSLRMGQAVTATGRSEDGAWIRIKVEGDARGVGWVSANYLSGDLAALAVVKLDSTAYGPMQAFYFTSSFSETPCTEAPNGLLVQSPSGAGIITLSVNGALLQLGSTAYLQTPAEDELLIRALDGTVTVTVGTESQTIVAGQQTSVPLQDNLAAGPPTEPQTFVVSEVIPLPAQLLPEAISVTEVEVEAITTEATAEAVSPEATPEATNAPQSGNAALTGDRTFIRIRGACFIYDSPHYETPASSSQLTAAPAGKAITFYVGYGAATTQYLDDYSQAVTVRLTFDGAEIPFGGLLTDVAADDVIWRFYYWEVEPPSSGDHQVTVTFESSTEITDGFDSNNDGVAPDYFVLNLTWTCTLPVSG